jgi:hypothetical protein
MGVACKCVGRMLLAGTGKARSTDAHGLWLWLVYRESKKMDAEGRGRENIWRIRVSVGALLRRSEHAKPGSGSGVVARAILSAVGTGGF